MHYVYIPRSENDENRHYIGCTNDLKRRLGEYAQGRTFATRTKGKLELAYYEAYWHQEESFKREKNLKLYANAYTGLKRRLPKTFGSQVSVGVK